MRSDRTLYPLVLDLNTVQRRAVEVGASLGKDRRRVDLGDLLAERIAEVTDLPAVGSVQHNTILEQGR